MEVKVLELLTAFGLFSGKWAKNEASALPVRTEAVCRKKEGTGYSFTIFLVRTFPAEWICRM